eukprot:5548192-Pleurochrysis_carterae.AAC.3
MLSNSLRSTSPVLWSQYMRRTGWSSLPEENCPGHRHQLMLICWLITRTVASFARAGDHTWEQATVIGLLSPLPQNTKSHIDGVGEAGWWCDARP